MRKTNGLKISNFLTRIIYVILLIFPLFLGTIYGLINLWGGWTWLFEGHNKEYYFQTEFSNKMVAFLVLVAIVLVVGLIIKFFYSCYKSFANRGQILKAKSVTVAVIFLMTVIIRMILLAIYTGEIQPFGDFKYAWDRANGDMSSLSHYSFFPAYINYSFIEKVISQLTGGNYETILFFCILCNAVTSVFIFLITDEIFDKYELSLLAAIIYLINPSSIAYALTSTPEHMAIACFAGSIYFICRYYDAQRIFSKIIFLIIAGIMGGIGNSVKTFFPIILVAVVIVLILSELKKSDQRKIKTISFLCFSVVLLFLSQKITTSGITTMSEKVFDVELNFADATPHFLNIGLNRQGEGQIHIGELSRLYHNDRTNGLSLEEAKVNARERVMNDWKGNIKEVPEFLVKKTIWTWQDDYIPIRYFMTALGLECDTFIEEVAYKSIATVGATHSQLWYILSMLLGIVGTMFTFSERESRQNFKLLLSNLMILGYFCLMILSEAQSRYKCLILPFLCIIDAYACMKIFDIIRKKLKAIYFSRVVKLQNKNQKTIVSDIEPRY